MYFYPSTLGDFPQRTILRFPWKVFRVRQLWRKCKENNKFKDLKFPVCSISRDIWDTKVNTNTQSEIRTTPHNVVCVPARAAVLQCCSAAGESGEVGWRVSLTKFQRSATRQCFCSLGWKSWWLIISKGCKHHRSVAYCLLGAINLMSDQKTTVSLFCSSGRHRKWN